MPQMSATPRATSEASAFTPVTPVIPVAPVTPCSPTPGLHRSPRQPPSPGTAPRPARSPLRHGFRPSHAVVALTLGAWFPAALATERGIAPSGVAWASGGVSHSELQDLHAHRQNYTFWLTTAALKSGAHLADVQVRIQRIGSHSDAPMLSCTMAGPWLFANLPPGRYVVEARYQADGQAAQVRRGITTLHNGDRRQMVLYFDTGDEVGAENTPAFEGNPYDGGRPR